MTQRQCLQQACKQRCYATHFPVKTSGCLKIRKQYIPSLSCFPNEAQQRSSKAAITELQKNSSWQWSSLRKALFTPRGLQEAVSVCSVSPDTPSVAELTAALCSAMDPVKLPSEAPKSILLSLFGNKLLLHSSGLTSTSCSHS